MGRLTLLSDGSSISAVSPVELLLVAAASCSAADVVGILEKQRVALETLEIVVRGTRRAEPPRRYTAIHFAVTVAGRGADEVKAPPPAPPPLEKYSPAVPPLAPD